MSSCHWLSAGSGKRSAFMIRDRRSSFAAPCCFWLGDAERIAELLERERNWFLRNNLTLRRDQIVDSCQLYLLCHEWSELAEVAERLVEQVRTQYVAFGRALVAEARSRLRAADAASETASDILARLPGDRSQVRPGASCLLC